MYVLTFIRRNSSATLTIPQLLEKLEVLEPTIEFNQTYDDEVQGAFDSAETTVRAALVGAQENAFWVGIGIGELKVPRFAAALGAISVSECAGDALDYSRIGVEQAQTGSPARGVVILGADRTFSEQATGLARLLYRVAAARTESENRVLALLVPGVRGQQKAVASALKISAQAVSKTLVRSLYHEQEASIPALVEIMITIDSRL